MSDAGLGAFRPLFDKHIARPEKHMHRLMGKEKGNWEIGRIGEVLLSVALTLYGPRCTSARATQSGHRGSALISAPPGSFNMLVEDEANEENG